MTTVTYLDPADPLCLGMLGRWVGAVGDEELRPAALGLPLLMFIDLKAWVGRVVSVPTTLGWLLGEGVAVWAPGWGCCCCIACSNIPRPNFTGISKSRHKEGNKVGLHWVDWNLISNSLQCSLTLSGKFLPHFHKPLWNRTASNVKWCSYTKLHMTWNFSQLSAAQLYNHSLKNLHVEVAHLHCNNFSC